MFHRLGWKCDVLWLSKCAHGVLYLLKTVVQWPFKGQNWKLSSCSLVTHPERHHRALAVDSIFPSKISGRKKSVSCLFCLSLSLSLPCVFFPQAFPVLSSNQLAKCFFREKALENVKSFRGSFFKLSYLRRVWGARSGHKKIHEVKLNLEVCSLVKNMV